MKNGEALWKKQQKKSKETNTYNQNEKAQFSAALDEERELLELKTHRAYWKENKQEGSTNKSITSLCEEVEEEEQAGWQRVKSHWE